MKTREWLGAVSLGLLLVCPLLVAAKNDLRPRMLVVVSPEAFHDQELQTVRETLRRRELRSILASTQGGEVKGMQGAVATPDYTLDQLKAENFDGMIVIGGPGAKTYLWFNAELKKILVSMNRLGRPIGAISVAPPALAVAGLLSGRRASVLGAPENAKVFSKYRVIQTGSEVTVDGNLITARSPGAAQAFADAVCRQMPGRTHAAPITSQANASPLAKPTVALPDKSRLPSQTRNKSQMPAR